ncbi:MAG TPA: tyrosine-type recombinase/integrase [Bellilinea sp.]|nr:tyrosine-type recombinase/integrase [Bellilinea sp.]
MLTVIQPHEIKQSGDVSLMLGEWYEALDLRVQAGELAANSGEAYKRGVGKFISWCEVAGIDSVSADVLRSWKAALLKSGKRPATVNAWMAGVKALFAWAVETKSLAYNPAGGVKGATRKGQTRKHAREALTDQEVLRVLAQPDTTTRQGKRDLAILAMMAYAGVRQVEINRADLGDLRTESGRLVLYVTGKGHDTADDIVVLANPKAENALHDWLAVRGNQGGPLFTSFSDRSSGQRLGLRAIRGIVKDYYQATGVHGNKTTHSLRHTAISKAIMKGAPIQKVQSMARHKSIDTTMIYYHELDRLTNPAEDFIDYNT